MVLKVLTLGGIALLLRDCVFCGDDSGHTPLWRLARGR